VRARLALATIVGLVLLIGPLSPSASAAADPLRGAQWALDAIHLGTLLGAPTPAPPAGQGVLVAVIDSGVDATHPDLVGHVQPGPDLVDNDGVPNDEQGHGTHMSGIIAATADNGIGGAGIAPAARIFAVRVLDRNNEGSAYTISRGINAAIDAGAGVINLSLNWSQPNEDLSRVTAAMQRAADAGIAVIVAAGNSGQNHCEQPVLKGRSLCVGAIDADLRLAPFSSHGADLGIVAPGADVISTWPGGRYARASGTSQAAAEASGVAALLVGMGLRGEQVIQRLVQTARDIGAPGYDGQTGFGMLDAARAVDGAAEGRIPPLLVVTSPAKIGQRRLRTAGLSVGCDAARPGICRVRVRARGVIVANGSSPVSGAKAVTVRARPTRAARRILKRRRALRGSVEVALSGAPAVRRALALRAP
jgi:subtilisin family serine protease